MKQINKQVSENEYLKKISSTQKKNKKQKKESKTWKMKNEK